MVELERIPRVKVCGLRRAIDVSAALDAGAEAIGLVEYPPSPRAVEAAQAAELVAALPADVLAVAVLVDRSPELAAQFARAARAGAVQLCGREQPADWTDFELPVLRRIAVSAGAEQEIERWRGVAAAFVLDHPAAPGGTGRGVALQHAARLCARAPCLLAGGLDEHNVAESVRRARPAGVDASSRLEAEPGVKDRARVRAFVRAALASLDEVAA